MTATLTRVDEIGVIEINGPPAPLPVAQARDGRRFADLAGAGRG